MSVSELLTPLPKAWSNLNVNSITANSNIIANQQSFMVLNSPNAGQTVQSSVAANALFNISGLPGGTNISYNTSTGVFTVNSNGNYLVTYSTFYPSAANGLRNSFISVTSSGKSSGIRASSEVGITATAEPCYLTGSVVLALSSGDTFFLSLNQNSGGSLTCNTTGDMSVYQLP